MKTLKKKIKILLLIKNKQKNTIINYSKKTQ